MESQYKKQNTNLTCENNINRSQEKEQNTVGQKQQSKHFVGVVIFSIVKQTIHSAYSDISYKCTKKSNKQQNNREQRIDHSSCLLSKCGSKHSPHKRQNHKQQC